MEIKKRIKLKHKIIIDLKNKCIVKYNLIVVAIDRKTIEELLDYVNRLETLVVTQNYLIESNDIDKDCDICPFKPNCIFTDFKEVDDCQVRMINQGKQINYVL